MVIVLQTVRLSFLEPKVCTLLWRTANHFMTMCEQGCDCNSLHDWQTQSFMVFHLQNASKHIWKKMTKSKHQFSSHLFKLAPDTFQRHQLETVQQKQSSTNPSEEHHKGQWFGFCILDYPEKANKYYGPARATIRLLWPFPVQLFKACKLNI